MPIFESLVSPDSESNPSRQLLKQLLSSLGHLSCWQGWKPGYLALECQFQFWCFKTLMSGFSFGLVSRLLKNRFQSVFGRLGPRHLGSGQMGPGQMNTRTNRSRTNGSRTIGSRTYSPGQIGNRTNGHQDNRVPDKWVLDIWVPDK